LIFINSFVSDAAYNFSVEEYYTRHAPFNVPLLMLWQADKCVMAAINQ
jgi:hypothetical protein